MVPGLAGSTGTILALPYVVAMQRKQLHIQLRMALSY